MTVQTTYYIGDVHGRHDLLQQLLGYISRDAKRRGVFPRVAFLGDLTDRGPESMQVVELVHEIIQAWDGSFLHLGNHDEWFLDAIVTKGKSPDSGSWFIHGGRETIESYGGGDFNLDALYTIPDRYPHHVALFRNAVLYSRNGPFIAAHAGLDPTVPVEDQGRGTLCWIRDSFLEYIDPAMAPVIHGHTIVGNLPEVTENRISIDTGAFDTDRLTCCVLDAERRELAFYQTQKGFVLEVQPRLIDRGFGTVFDRLPALFESRPASPALVA